MLQLAVLQFFRSQTLQTGIQAPICLLHILLQYVQIMESVWQSVNYNTAKVFGYYNCVTILTIQFYELQ